MEEELYYLCLKYRAGMKADTEKIIRLAGELSIRYPRLRKPAERRNVDRICRVAQLVLPAEPKENAIDRLLEELEINLRELEEVGPEW